MPDRPDLPDRRDLLRLLRRQSEVTLRFSAVFGDTHGLHQTDLSALAAIAEAVAADAPLGPARLADTLHLSRPATTALLDRLESAGHVVRRADPGDRRRTVIEMQPEASKLASEFFGPLGRSYAEVMDAFDEDELDLVARFLEGIVSATVATQRSLRPPGDDAG